jgi:hypothetical protein
LTEPEADTPGQSETIRRKQTPGRPCSRSQNDVQHSNIAKLATPGQGSASPSTHLAQVLLHGRVIRAGPMMSCTLYITPRPKPSQKIATALHHPCSPVRPCALVCDVLVDALARNGVSCTFHLVVCRGTSMPIAASKAQGVS